jgi:hypothetical protein
VATVVPTRDGSINLLEVRSGTPLSIHRPGHDRSIFLTPRRSKAEPRSASDRADVKNYSARNRTAVQGSVRGREHRPWERDSPAIRTNRVPRSSATPRSMDLTLLSTAAGVLDPIREGVSNPLIERRAPWCVPALDVVAGIGDVDRHGARGEPDAPGAGVAMERLSKEFHNSSIATQGQCEMSVLQFALGGMIVGLEGRTFLPRDEGMSPFAPRTATFGSHVRRS